MSTASVFFCFVWVPFVVEARTSLVLASQVSNQTFVDENESCSAEQEYFYSRGGGRCCTRCGPGSGMVRLCTLESDTQCGSCKPGFEFSKSASTRDKCEPCSKCHSFARGKVRENCSTTQDAICECIPGYFLVPGPACRPCSKCQPGFGASSPCSWRNDTVCRRCPAGTFSAGQTATKSCQACRKCRPGEKLLRACSATGNAICCAQPPCAEDVEKEIKEAGDNTMTSNQQPRNRETWHQIAIFNVNNPNNATKEVNSTLGDPYSSKAPSPDPRSRTPTATDHIPLYCGLMSLVIVFLVAYVAYKYWNTRCRATGGGKSLPGGLLSGSNVFHSSKSKSRAAGSAAGTSAEDPEGCGVKLMAMNSDKYPSPGQDGHHPELSATRLRVLESHLPPEVWRDLAQSLEFSLDDMMRMEAQSHAIAQPALRVLLRDFASRPSATGEHLAMALQVCGQHEAASLLLTDVVISESDAPRV